MTTLRDYLLDEKIDEETIDAWIGAGWVQPPDGSARDLAEIDVARVQLIKDLKKDFGVNDEGIDLLLHLIDQLHGLRSALRSVLRGQQRH